MQLFKEKTHPNRKAASLWGFKGESAETIAKSLERAQGSQNYKHPPLGRSSLSPPLWVDCGQLFIKGVEEICVVFTFPQWNRACEHFPSHRRKIPCVTCKRGPLLGSVWPAGAPKTHPYMASQASPKETLIFLFPNKSVGKNTGASLTSSDNSNNKKEVNFNPQPQASHLGRSSFKGEI